MAAFRCCRCQVIGIEVHHIIPEKDDGCDDIDNAAPLCAKCHADFGDNPLKRKEIRQMRDWWYKKAAETYSQNTTSAKLEGKINDLVLATRTKKEELGNLKATLKEYINLKIDSITLVTSQSTSTDIVNLATGRPFQSSLPGFTANSEQGTLLTIDPGTEPPKSSSDDGETA